MTTTTTDTKGDSAATTTTTLCEGGCGKTATLRCPTCLKQGGEGQGFFCSQTCFRAAWTAHKATHKAPTTPNGAYDPFPRFRYTGKHRAVYPLSTRRTVPASIGRPDYAADGIPHAENALRGSAQIKVNSATEIRAMRRAGKVAREVMNEGLRAIKVGVTTDEVDRVVHDAAVARGAYPSPLNYRGFPKSCCVSVNEVICHGIPDQYVIQDGDLVNLDVTTYFQGFHGDLNETVCVGNVDRVGRLLVKTTRECFERARDMCRPGVLYRDLGAVIQHHASANGFAVVRSFTGHGISDQFHTAPSVYHYARNKAVGVMQPGHIFTIEPMISEGAWQDVMWPDDWTAVTADGKRSAQFEQTLLITETGVETLTGDFFTPMPEV